MPPRLRFALSIENSVKRGRRRPATRSFIPNDTGCPMTERIYLDNAATSWPKPEGVYVATDRYQRRLGAPAGRSSYATAGEVEQEVQSARGAIATLINAPNPREVVFGFNGTDALNMAIHGALRPGDHVVTSVVEHNSVLRPLRMLEEQGIIEVTRVRCDGETRVDPEEVRQALRPQTRLVALIHASNVTGALQPVAEVAELAQQHGALFLLDAAQTLGHESIDVQATKIDLLAAPGHKGLLGPLGTGVLYVRSGVEKHLRPLRQGGTGTQSELDQQPEEMPYRMESGNHNMPGLCGLRAALGFLQERGVAAIREHLAKLTEQLVSSLGELPGVTVYGPAELLHRAPVVCITVEGYDSRELPEHWMPDTVCSSGRHSMCPRRPCRTAHHGRGGHGADQPWPDDNRRKRLIRRCKQWPKSPRRNHG